MSIENHGGMLSTGKKTDSSTRGLYKSYQQSHLVAKRRNVEGSDEYGSTKYLYSYFEGIFTVP
jgi:hypothetical protein